VYKEELFKLEGLKKENQYLKKLLSYIMQHGNHHAFAVPPDKILTRRSSPEDKIALFKLLFKGRSDTYAVRWETKNGKSGYAPACQLEWQRPILPNTGK
jgi:hypothetical protein